MTGASPAASSQEVPLTAIGPASRPFRHRRRLALYVPVVALAVTWAAMLLAVPHVRVDADLRTAALFAHLAALVLGFGGVLTLDWFGLMWMLGRQTLTTLVRVAQVVQTPIWLGLAGLTLSGMFLSPNTSEPLVVVKLCAVLLVAVNGLLAARVHDRLTALDGRHPPVRLLVASLLVAGVSQAGWWTATIVGFLSTQR
jgi:hypothetical protein